MRFKRKYNELKKIKNFLIILLKLVFSDKIINRYCSLGKPIDSY